MPVMTCSRPVVIKRSKLPSTDFVIVIGGLLCILIFDTTSTATYLVNTAKLVIVLPTGHRLVERPFQRRSGRV